MAKMFNHKKPVILTPYEEKILILMCEDIPLLKVAKRLEVTNKNVYTTLSNMRKKNNVKTNFGLIIRYLRNGYLTEI